jgi:hypothetical protein
MHQLQAIKSKPSNEHGARREARTLVAPVSEHDRWMELQRGIGNQAVSRMLGRNALPGPSAETQAQPARIDGGNPVAAASGPSLTVRPKLEIGSVDDPLEREADRVAAHVMRMPVPEPSIAATPLHLGYKVAARKEEGKLQQKPAGPQSGTAEAPASVHDVLRSPGQPLDVETRAYFEPRFGYDFGRVRVHTDASSANSAASVRARAYVRGADIVYGAGARPGVNLLTAHELAHVAQSRPACEPNVIRRAPGDGPSKPGGNFDVVSDVWEVEDEEGVRRGVIVVKSGDKIKSFYQRSSSELKGRVEGHMGPQEGDFAPFDGFDEKGGFVKERYWSSPFADPRKDPNYGWGDPENKRISQGLAKRNLPKPVLADWRAVQVRLQQLKVDNLKYPGPIKAPGPDVRPRGSSQASHIVPGQIGGVSPTKGGTPPGSPPPSKKPGPTSGGGAGGAVGGGRAGGTTPATPKVSEEGAVEEEEGRPSVSPRMKINLSGKIANLMLQAIKTYTLIELYKDNEAKQKKDDERIRKEINFRITAKADKIVDMWIDYTPNVYANIKIGTYLTVKSYVSMGIPETAEIYHSSILLDVEISSSAQTEHREIPLAKWTDQGVNAFGLITNTQAVLLPRDAALVRDTLKARIAEIDRQIAHAPSVGDTFSLQLYRTELQQKLSLFGAPAD